jgi:putative membrane protein
MNLVNLKRILLGLIFILLVFCGVWLVVTNQQAISLNLLFVAIPTINSGVVVLVSFALGCVVGVFASVFIFKLLPLRWQLRQSQREIAELRKQNARPPL